MTVAELIEELKRFSPEALVLRGDNLGGFESLCGASLEPVVKAGGTDGKPGYAVVIE